MNQSFGNGAAGLGAGSCMMCPNHGYESVPGDQVWIHLPVVGTEVAEHKCGRARVLGAGNLFCGLGPQAPE